MAILTGVTVWTMATAIGEEDQQAKEDGEGFQPPLSPASDPPGRPRVYVLLNVGGRGRPHSHYVQMAGTIPMLIFPSAVLASLSCFCSVCDSRFVSS